MTAAEFNANEFQTDNIIEVTYNDNTKSIEHLWNGHAFMAGDGDGLDYSHIRVIGGEQAYKNINLEDVKSVSIH